MPIDPRIPGLATQGFNTPFQNLGGMLEIQQAQQQQEAHALTLQKAKREEQERVAIQRVLQESGGDLSDATLNRITQVAPALGVKFRGDLFDNRKKLADATKAEMESEAKQTEWGLSLLNAAKANPALYPQVRAIALQGGGDIAKLLAQHPQYDPATVDGLLQTGLTAKERLDMDQKVMDGLMKGDYRYLAGSLAAVQDQPDELKERIEAWRFQGVPKAVLDTLLTDPQGLSMTEEERGQAADRQADNTRQMGTAAETQRHNAVVEGQGAQRVAIARQRAAGGGAEPLFAVHGRDGLPVLVRRSQAEGKRPASDRQNAGARGVVSGDANRIADFDTSLSDVNVLRNEIGVTGAVSGVEAAIPNWVSDITGLGQGAKTRQAVIDRVKQVIGKALEGGVLRREDEYKYTKILPTISDPPAVAKFKLDGLEKALIERRSTLLDSLSDAGYDTSRYEARPPRETSAPPPPGERNRTPIGGQQGVEVTYRGRAVVFPDQAKADEFKRRMGIR